VAVSLPRLAVLLWPIIVLFSASQLPERIHQPGSNVLCVEPFEVCLDLPRLTSPLAEEPHRGMSGRLGCRPGTASPVWVDSGDEEASRDSCLFPASHRRSADVDRPSCRPAGPGDGREAGMGDLRSYPVCALPVRAHWRRPVVNDPSRGPADHLSRSGM
jgi:hypothetical protein